MFSIRCKYSKGIGVKSPTGNLMLNIQLVYLIIILTFSNFFQSLEHCIGDFLDNCDENDDHDISFQGTNLLGVLSTKPLKVMEFQLRLYNRAKPLK